MLPQSLFNKKFLIHLVNLKSAVFLRGSRSQSTVEYAIVLVVLIIACIGVIALFSDALSSMFNKLANTRAGVLGVGP